jgi:glycosyltransferase involved in cell wall biosynthesis
MTREQIQGFHKRGDCFILPSRGEGFGIPLAEAMAFGNPCIGSNYGGVLEFMNQENSFLADCQVTPVSGMIFSNYNGKMCWGHPDVMQLRKYMRFVYENREAAKEIAVKGRDTIKEKFSWEIVGNTMVNRLEQIQRRNTSE